MTPLVLEAGLGALCTGGCVGALMIHEQQRAGRALAVRLDRVASPYRAAGRGSKQRLAARSGFGWRQLLVLLTGGRQPGEVLLVTAALSVAAAFFLARAVGPVGVFAGPALIFVLPRLYARRVAGKRRAMLFKQFPDALGMIVRAVRVGVPVSAALAVVAQESADPTATEFRLASEEIAIGRSLTEALHAMAARTQSTEYRFFATALSLQSQTGGALTETLETLAETIRQRVATRDRGYALASEARMTCWILGALPFALAALMRVLNPSYINVLFTTGSGRMLLLVAVALLSTGIFAMQAITRNALR